MGRLIAMTTVLLLPVTCMAAQASAIADSYRAVAHFTSGVVDGEPVDRIDAATTGHDMIVLYVDWEGMRMRAYRTEVHVVDPTGRVMGKIRNTIQPGSSRFYTYYYYRPDLRDTPGEWTYQLYVDGRAALEARIPIEAK